MAKASLQEIVDSLEMQFDEYRQFLDRQTGAVELLDLAELRLAEEPDQPEEDLPAAEESHESVIARAVIEDPDRFVRLPTKWDIHEWQIMCDFAESVAPDRLRDDLLNALHGSGAFRYFKDTLRRYRREDDWHLYRTAALRRIAIDWCKENDIEYQEDNETPQHGLNSYTRLADSQPLADYQITAQSNPKHCYSHVSIDLG
ncbi:MAG: UPF0158 family protein [Bryobacteraceae bacterium]